MARSMVQVLLLFALLGAPAFADDAVATQPSQPIASGKANFTVLTPAMIRLEYSPDGTSERRPSQAFIHRDLPVPSFDVERNDNTLTIRTAELTLTYIDDGRPFHAGNLSIEFQFDGQTHTWHPGLEDTGNLRGTTRTLDGISGSCPLEPGLLSRDGWVCVDDSDRLVFDDGEPAWLTPRDNDERTDWYFMAYGRDYSRALRDFTRVAGRIPLPPRYVFGAWWSRYWAYTADELRRLVREFAENDVPLDVLVIDMDWHLDGWTGYTWNPESFPDPNGFLDWTRQQGLKVTLNLHPADGVASHEAAFDAMCRALGRDPAETQRIPFDCTDRDFVDVYFRILHHPFEMAGVDFWWIDWQQGEQTAITGLDPLWWLNHLHWSDMARREDRTGRRPLIFSRWGGLGNHRYQIGFSGDTFCNWPSLAFQPYFTATAGNVGFAYWSHDIGGHQPGPVEPELYARWIQYGVFSPVLRTHTTKNPEAERRIWAFPRRVFEAGRAAYHLRYALIPYIYTAARQCYDTGMPLCRPLYYHWPDLNEAYARTDHYMFGDDLLVAPVVEPASPISGCAQREIWLPPGTWSNWFTGEVHTGPTVVRRLVPLNEIPVFLRGGAIIPTSPRMQRSDARPVDPLILNLFAGSDAGETRIYEDDGISPDYESGAAAWTPVRYRRDGDRLDVTIGPAEGGYDGMPEARQYELRVIDSVPPASVAVDGEPVAYLTKPSGTYWWYDQRQLAVVVWVAARPTSEPVSIRIDLGEHPALARQLAGGLRGRLALIDDFAREAGGEGAVEMGLAAKNLRGALAARGQADFDAQLNTVTNTPRLVAAIRASDLDPEPRDRLISRALGLLATFNIQPIRGGMYAGQIETAIHPGAPWAEDLSLRTTYEPPSNWKIAGVPRTNVDRTPGGISLSTQLPLEPTGAKIQTAVLEASIVVTGDGVRFSRPLMRTLFPSINRWWIVGPFDGGSMEQSLAREFPPEQKVDLDAEFTGQNDVRIHWQRLERRADAGAAADQEFFIDFDEVFGRRVYDGVAYAYTLLHAPRDMKATLAIGSDDGAAVWLNGEEVHRNAIGRPYTSREDRVPVQLRAGINPLLVKINQGGGDWAFCVHVETAGGKPIPDITTHLTAPAAP